MVASDYFTDGVGNGTTTFTSASASFTASDVGRYLHGKNFPLSTSIIAVNNATTVTLGAAVPSGTSVPFWIGRHIISGGNNGMTLGQWFGDPALACPYNRNRLVADSPDLIEYSWLVNDIRQGGMGTTLNACVAAGIAQLQALIDWTRTTLPDADILLRIPAPFLTTNVGANNFVTDGSTVNPTGLAQVYSTALRRMYLHFVGRYPNVDVLDTQAEIFGTRCVSTHPLMIDQLHPSTGLTGDVYGFVPSGGGYTLIADAIAKRIGFDRNAFPAEGAQRVRHEFYVYDGPSAGTIRLGSRDAYGLPATQAPVFRTDLLYINGLDSPLSLTSANVDRTYSPTFLQISGLGATDFSPYIGQTAVATGNHAPMTTQDRQQIFLDLPSIGAGVTSTVSVAVTGVATGQTGSATGVIASPGNVFGSSSLLLLGAYPSATNTVRLVIQNPTGSAIDLAGESWTFWVVR
jgi:lysophospholipase L1-like esterase